ncbi:FAD-binding oxidoreductase [Ralstonia holmesii]|uniref:FAD-binding oxidoreductase n=1 Tax=Ralstonia holmesii TaxID=3058602 RepID=UPI00292D146D|nr:FAD-binding oxidoreductase [Ralstonia sp. LMG 32967]
MNLQDELRAIVGANNVIAGADADPYLVDWRGRYKGRAQAVVRPGNTEEVATVMRLCHQHKTPVVTQGGNTGLCGGATLDESGDAIVLSLSRLNTIRAIDIDNDTLVVDAGCTLSTVQEAARNVGRLFPLSLAAEGTCTIGGNLATNAGGTQVLRYGNARDLTLGLEVVTPEGDIWHGLRGLRKDNTGYDLRDLFIGSEGTLGIITGATLKLYPRPAAQRTAMLALDSLDNAIRLLAHAKSGFGPSLTAFEVMAGSVLHDVVRLFPPQRLPFEGPSGEAPYFALLELSDMEGEAHAQAQFETVLGAAMEDGLVLDAAIAENLTQSKAFWHLRESVPLAEANPGKSIKHDVSVPISAIAEFVSAADAALKACFPTMSTIVFGHLGDGNVHYNVSRGADQTEEQVVALTKEVYAIVHDIAHRLGGSISAEHGIGQHKRDELPRYKHAVELRLMRQIKTALDPHNLMNPGKVLPQADAR